MVFWLSFTVYVVADEKEGKGGGGVEGGLSVLLTLDAIDGALLAAFADAVDVVHGDAIVEPAVVEVAEVAQPVPLRRHLRVERPHVVVDRPPRLRDELLVE